MAKQYATEPEYRPYPDASIKYWDVCALGICWGIGLLSIVLILLEQYELYVLDPTLRSLWPGFIGLTCIFSLLMSLLVWRNERRWWKAFWENNKFLKINKKAAKRAYQEWLKTGPKGAEAGKRDCYAKLAWSLDQRGNVADKKAIFLYQHYRQRQMD